MCLYTRIVYFEPIIYLYIYDDENDYDDARSVFFLFYKKKSL
jgi:hypothetical protein